MVYSALDGILSAQFNVEVDFSVKNLHVAGG